MNNLSENENVGNQHLENLDEYYKDKSDNRVYDEQQWTKILELLGKW